MNNTNDKQKAVAGAGNAETQSSPFDPKRDSVVMRMTLQFDVPISVPNDKNNLSTLELAARLQDVQNRMVRWSDTEVENFTASWFRSPALGNPLKSEKEQVIVPERGATATVRAILTIDGDTVVGKKFRHDAQLEEALTVQYTPKAREKGKKKEELPDIDGMFEAE